MKLLLSKITLQKIRLKRAPVIRGFFIIIWAARNPFDGLSVFNYRVAVNRFSGGESAPVKQVITEGICTILLPEIDND